MNSPCVPRWGPAGAASSASCSPIADSGLGWGRSRRVLRFYQTSGSLSPGSQKQSFPNEADFHVHVPVLLFSVGLALLTGILFGLFPALQLSRPEIGQDRTVQYAKGCGSVRGKRLHAVLIGSQIALTMLLLTAAGASIEGFLHMMHVDLGYNPHNVMSVGIPVHQNTFSTWAERSNYFTQLRDKLATLPGVIATGTFSTSAPPDSGWSQAFEPKARRRQKIRKRASTSWMRAISAPWRFRSGGARLWTETEIQHGALMAVVNEKFVKQYYADRDILSGSMRIPTLKSDSTETLVAPGSDGWLQVIGVTAKDALDDGLDKPTKPAIYLPYTVNMWMWTQILVEPGEITHPCQRQTSVVLSIPTSKPPSGTMGLWRHGFTIQQVFARGRLVSVLFAAFFSHCAAAGGHRSV